MANAFSNSSTPRAPKSGDGDGNGKKRRYSFSLSFAGLLTSGIIMIIAVGWVFAFGVIVGRGYNPEKKLPELASLLPPPPGAQTEPPPQAILKPEELTFMSDLKQRNPDVAVPLARTDAAQATPSAQAANQTKPAPVAPPAEKKPQFNFVFQAAAFKKKEQADKLRERMNDEGLRSRLTIEKDGAGKPKWYRVQVLVRGTDADAAQAKQRMDSLGLRDARQASKTPVSTKKSK